MKRITFTLDERGFIHRICADEEVEVCIVDPNARHGRVDRWNALEVGCERVDEEIGGRPAMRVGCRRSIEPHHPC